MNNQSEKIIGKYPIIKQIARSPQGLVFLSKSPTTNTPAIVKFFPSKLAQSQAFMKQFMNELSHLKQLAHPNILPITYYGLTDKFPSIEIPYMLGGDLATRIQKGANWAHFKDAIGQICQALVYAHRQGIIHGNLKPSNILFNQNGDAYLTDFRLSCLEDYIPYTPSDYSSPEQIRGERLDQRSDVYSLGMLIYVWVTGKNPPYSALAYSEHEYEPLSLRWDVPNISVAMDEVIQQATQYDPANRFSSVKEFYHAFFDALRVDKMFLQMLSGVKSDVTLFAQGSKLDDFAGGRALEVEVDEADGTIKTKTRVKWRDFSIGFVGMAIVILIFRFMIPYLMNYTPSPPYEPAYNPPGFAVVAGRSIEMSAPTNWINRLESPESSVLADAAGEVNIDLGIVADFFESVTDLPQIVLQSPNGGAIVTALVTIYQDSSLENLQSRLIEDLNASHYIVKDAQKILLPAGWALLVRSIYNATPSYPAESHIYAFLFNGKMYLLNFIGDATDVSTFDVMIQTFRIKS